MLPPVRPAILLVDDDLTLLSAVSRRVARAGYDVRTAHSGPAALKQLEGSWPALLVVDLMMPGMDGFELCRRVKQIADLPIIVLSAVDASEAKVSALELYAEDYVTKPFDPDELVARIQRVLRQRAGRPSADRPRLAGTWRSTSRPGACRRRAPRTSSPRPRRGCSRCWRHRSTGSS